MQTLLFLVLVLLALPSSSTQANIDNRNFLPFGEREAFTANAGVAGGPSSGAVFYNPAALVQLTESRIALNGNTYLSLKTSTDKFLHVNDTTDVPYENSGFNSIPSTVISTVRLADWTLAYFVLVPEAFQLQNRQSLDFPGATATLIEVQSTSDLWLGTSVAHAIDDQWSLGLSLFLIQHQDSNVASITASSTTGTTVATGATQYLQSSVYGLSATAGAFFRANSYLNLGFRVQTPLIRLSGKGNGYSSRYGYDGTTFANNEEKKDGIASQYVLPLDMSVGARWMISPTLSFLTDLSFQLGATYDPFPGLSFSNKIQSVPTLRINLGVETQLTSSFELASGFLFNPSTLPASTTQGSVRQDIYGLTLGGFLTSGRIRTGLGAFYLWATGDFIPFSSTATPAGPAKVSRRGMGGTLTVSYYL